MYEFTYNVGSIPLPCSPSGASGTGRGSIPGDASTPAEAGVIYPLKCDSLSHCWNIKYTSTKLGFLNAKLFLSVLLATVASQGARWLVVQSQILPNQSNQDWTLSDIYPLTCWAWLHPLLRKTILRSCFRRGSLHTMSRCILIMAEISMSYFHTWISPVSNHATKLVDRWDDQWCPNSNSQRPYFDNHDDYEITGGEIHVHASDDDNDVQKISPDIILSNMIANYVPNTQRQELSPLENVPYSPPPLDEVVPIGIMITGIVVKRTNVLR